MGRIGYCMKALVPAIATVRVALILMAAILVARAESKSSPEAQVVVVRATNGCFSAAIRVTGFLVARDEAIVTLDAPGVRVSEVLVGEGDRVSSGQTLVRLTKQTTEGPEPPGAPKSPTILKSRRLPAFLCSYPGIRTWGSSSLGVGWRGGFTASLYTASAASGRCRSSLRAEQERGDLRCGWARIQRL